MKHLTPLEAHAYLQTHRKALFVDVRMEIEYLYVGHPPGVVHLSWYEYPEMQPHAKRFALLVKREAGDDLVRPVVLPLGHARGRGRQGSSAPVSPRW